MGRRLKPVTRATLNKLEFGVASLAEQQAAAQVIRTMSEELDQSIACPHCAETVWREKRAVQQGELDL